MQQTWLPLAKCIKMFLRIFYQKEADILDSTKSESTRRISPAIFKGLLRNDAGKKLSIKNPYLLKTVLNKYGCTILIICDE